MGIGRYGHSHVNGSIGIIPVVIDAGSHMHMICYYIYIIHLYIYIALSKGNNLEI